MIRLWLGTLGALIVSLNPTPSQAQGLEGILGRTIERTMDRVLERAPPVEATPYRPSTVPPGGIPDNAGITVEGVTFPQGHMSFADEVVSYTPGSPAPTNPYRGAEHALGLPDYNGLSTCSSQANCTDVALGSGGTLVVRFTDNVLTGSGNSDADLWIFETGPQVEAMFVEISQDGRSWHSVGAIGGGKSGVDIDAFGFGQTSSFAYVRLTDDPDKDGRSGPTVGADIDAVGAISTKPAAGCTCAGNR